MMQNARRKLYLLWQFAFCTDQIATHRERIFIKRTDRERPASCFCYFRIGHIKIAIKIKNA